MYGHKPLLLYWHIVWPSNQLYLDIAWHEANKKLYWNIDLCMV